MKLKQFTGLMCLIAVVGMAYATIDGMVSPNEKILIMFSGAQTITLIGIMLCVLYPNDNKN